MDDLIDALIAVVQVQKKRDKACCNCPADWEYFGHDIEQRLQKAKDLFGIELRKVIVENAPRGGGSAK